jgi:hypothetical protein
VNDYITTTHYTTLYTGRYEVNEEGVFQINSYKEIAELGVGMLGKVMLCEDVRTQALVAVKELFGQLLVCMHVCVCVCDENIPTPTPPSLCRIHTHSIAPSADCPSPGSLAPAVWSACEKIWASICR